MVRDEFLTEVRNVYVSLLNIAMGIVDVDGGKEHSEFGALPIGFIYKQCLHAYTVWSIVQPVPREELVFLQNGAVMFDFASLAHVVRAMFELDVTMRYLFLDAPTEEERSFRIEMWILHGMCRQRQGVHGLQISCDEKLEAIDERIAQKIAEIRHLPYYVSMQDKKDTDRKLAENAKEYRQYFSNSNKITSIAKRLGYDARMVDSMYVHASAYTHTNAFSIIQLITESDTVSKFLECDYMLEYARIILSRTITAFAECDYRLNKNYDKGSTDRMSM